MKTVLFLDDDPTRHDLFDKSMSDVCQITHVKTSQQAIDALRCQKFDAASLDHDLGDFGSGEVGDGMEVAEFIALHLQRANIPDLVFVHSFNAPAAKRMTDCLMAGNITTVQDAWSPSAVAFLKRHI